MSKAVWILTLSCAFATLALAQEGALPPGKWWRQPRVIQEIGITEEQQTRLDAIFQNSANELIDLKGEVEKRTLALRHEMDQAEVSRQNVQRVAAGLSQARARLFERELMMFVDMRSVLSQEQWSRFRRVLEQRQAFRRDRRMQQRGPMHPRNRPPDRRPQRPDEQHP